MWSAVVDGDATLLVLHKHIIHKSQWPSVFRFSRRTLFSCMSLSIRARNLLKSSANSKPIFFFVRQNTNNKIKICNCLSRFARKIMIYRFAAQFFTFRLTPAISLFAHTLVLLHFRTIYCSIFSATLPHSHRTLRRETTSIFSSKNLRLHFQFYRVCINLRRESGSCQVNAMNVRKIERLEIGALSRFDCTAWNVNWVFTLTDEMHWLWGWHIKYVVWTCLLERGELLMAWWALRCWIMSGKMCRMRWINRRDSMALSEFMTRRLCSALVFVINMQPVDVCVQMNTDDSSLSAAIIWCTLSGNGSYVVSVGNQRMEVNSSCVCVSLLRHTTRSALCTEEWKPPVSGYREENRPSVCYLEIHILSPDKGHPMHKIQFWITFDGKRNGSYHQFVPRKSSSEREMRL